MTRKFLFFVMAIVVLQFSWTAISAYCEHETGRAAQHFGHHQHTAHADDVADKSSPLAKKLAPHADCASCAHMTLAFAKVDAVARHPLDAEADPLVADAPLSSAYLPPPERPKWTAAA